MASPQKLPEGAEFAPGRVNELFVVPDPPLVRQGSEICCFGESSQFLAPERSDVDRVPVFPICSSRSLR